MNRRGGLQGVVGALLAEVVGRQTMQLVIDQRGESLESSLVAVTPLDQQFRNAFRGEHDRTFDDGEASGAGLLGEKAGLLRPENCDVGTTRTRVYQKNFRDACPLSPAKYDYLSE